MSILSLKRRRDVGRQKWQFVAVLVTVVLGVMMFGGSFNAYLNLGSSLEGTYDRLAMADMVVTGAEDGFVDAASGVNDVEKAIDRRQADVPFAIDEYTLVGRVIGMPVDEQPAINQIDIDDGTYLDPTDPTGVVLEHHAAADFDLTIGDTFEILATQVTVIGIATSPEYLWPAKDSQNLFTPPKTFAVVFVDEAMLEGVDSTAIADQVLVLYAQDADTQLVDDDVTRVAESASASDVQPVEDQASNHTINLEIDGLRTMAIAFPILFLSAAGLAIYVVLTRIVFSQRGVIGTLRATGFGRGAMARHYRLFGVGVGVVGAAIGAVLGGLMARGLTAIYVQVFGIPDLVANFHAPTVVFSLLFGLVAGAAAASPPARKVAGMAPAEAMRGAAPSGVGRRSLFERVIPPLRRAPVRWLMTLRGIGRNKGRSLAMVFGVILGMVLIMASLGVLDTMVSAIDTQFEDVAIEDATTVFGVPVGETQVQSIVDVNGVELAEPVIGLSATVAYAGASYDTLLEGYEPNTQVHGFPDGLPAEGVLLGRGMESLLNVEEGDRVTIKFDTLESSISVAVSGFVDEPMSTQAYMQASTLEEALAKASTPIPSETLASPTITTVKSVFEVSAVDDAVLERIEAVPDVLTVIDAGSMRAAIDQFQVFFYVFVGMMLIFGGAMAFALIFNIISVNVAERTGEFASMRANGLTHRKVASLIAGETYLLTAIGLIPGFIAGYIAAAAFLGSFTSEDLPMPLDIRPLSYLLTGAVMFVVAGLSLFPAVRAVKRINVGEVVRERAV